MSKVQTEMVGVRMTPQIREGLRLFAERHAMVNKAGEANISEAARTIIALALSNGVPENIYKTAFENARTEWMERVNGGWRAAMEALTQIGLR